MKRKILPKCQDCGNIINKSLEDIIKEYRNNTLVLNVYMGGQNTVKTNENNFNGNVYGGVNSTQQGNINTNTYIGSNDNTAELTQLLESFKNLIVESEGIEQDDKDNVTDDLDNIREQIECERPNVTRIRKALNGIKFFVSRLPQGLARAEVILSTGQNVMNKVNDIIASFS